MTPDEMTARLDRAFPLHAGDDDHTTQLKSMYRDLWKAVAAQPPCREQSTALTKLEDSGMWAVKAYHLEK